MKEGRVVEHGPAARILDAPKDAYTRSLIAAMPDREDYALSGLRAAPVPPPTLERQA